MKRGLWVGVLAVLAFVVILLVRLPASWLAGALPADVACGEITGTVWNGGCGALTLQHAPLGNLNWQVHATALLTGTLASQVELNGPAGSVIAEIEAHSTDRFAARNLRATFTLDPALLPHSPPTLRGTVQADLSRLRIENGRIAELAGRFQVHDLEQRGSDNRQLGDYMLTFPAKQASHREGELVGDVHSTGGPFAVEGTLRLTPEPGFELECLIAANAGATPEVLQQLGYLGTPDAHGRRPFSVAGTF